MKMEKPIVLVHEVDELKGGERLEVMKNECPAELRQFVFGDDSVGGLREIIQWHRVTPFQISALLRIASSVIQPSLDTSVHLSRDASTPRPRHSAGTKNQALYLASACTEEKPFLPEGLVVYVSPNNPGAMARMKELISSDSAVSITSEASSLRNTAFSKKATHMCLYLNASTFIAVDGDPHAGENLAAEVTSARASGIPMVLLHENDLTRGGCAFERFFYSTPDPLIDAGLYNDIASHVTRACS